MSIQVGENMPEGTLTIMGEEGPGPLATDDLFKGKKVVLFAVPGAFTSACSAKHLPGFVANSDAIKSKGVDAIGCLSVNDVFVMSEWGKAHGADSKVLMLADGNAEYVKKLGLDLDASGFGMGTRAERFAIIVENCKVLKILRESVISEVKESSAENILENL